MQIRDFNEPDWPEVWPIFQEIIQAEETYPYDPTMTAEEAHSLWIEQPPAHTVVAVEAVEAGRIVGTAKMGPNRPGPGAHVSTASFMVAANARGQGVGAALCRHALAWARTNGYAGMQFNAVVETNAVAVELYKRLGFTIIGTVPRAFAHKTLGRVGLHVMYCEF